MLQQTRVDTVIPYYNRFIDAFPTVYELSEANQQNVLKLWEGLGYYSRARNLHQAAKTIVKDFNGELPDAYPEITSLKGIGPYTAAAVLSIAFNKKYAVVDGNVIRVLTRFYGITEDIRSSSTKNRVQQLADDLIPESEPGNFNQAVMELGATVCKPTSPLCTKCPLSAQCIANQTVQTDTIPYKSPAKKIPHHTIAVGLIVNKQGELLIALRPNDAMLGGLWEFPGGKKKKKESIKETVKRELNEELDITVRVHSRFNILKHAYSHFKITLHAYWCSISHGAPSAKSSQEIKWVALNEIDQYPFPKANKTLVNGLQSMSHYELIKKVES